MARIAIASGDSCSTAWWMRLQAEGTNVMVWNKTERLKRTGEGLVPLAGTFDELYFFCKEGQRSREPVLMVFDMSEMGEKADEVRKYGIPMLGGGSFCDKLEKDRLFGFEIAEAAGCRLPAYEQFSTLDESLKSAPDQEVYFKADRLDNDKNATKMLKDKEQMTEHFKMLKRNHGNHLKHILQEKIEGVALSTARWWNGHSLVGPYEGTFEQKGLLDGNIGSSTGCAINAVFFYPTDPQIAEMLGWDNLTQIFREHQAPPGLYDMNALIGEEDGEAYFLEWTPRFGYDSEMSSFRLFPDLSRHLFAIGSGGPMPPPSGDLAFATRLWIPPYPWGHPSLAHKGNVDGWPIGHVDGMYNKHFIPYEVRQDPEIGLCVCGPDGIVGLSLAIGKELSKLNEEAVEYAKELGKTGIDSLGFRTDGEKALKEDAEKVQAMGLEVHEGMLK